MLTRQFYSGAQQKIGIPGENILQYLAVVLLVRQLLLRRGVEGRASQHGAAQSYIPCKQRIQFILQLPSQLMAISDLVGK